jgi:GntR family transcriptional regulator/MocR family aminotransferase
MPQHEIQMPFPSLIVNATSSTPLFRQLYESLQQAILDGQFVPGTKLPSTRSLAGHLGVSRNTVHLAFEQLIAEGYLEGRQGAGTYVSAVLPEERLNLRSETPRIAKLPGQRSPLSQRSARLLQTYPRQNQNDRHTIKAFKQGLPALDRFPRQIWQRLLVRSWRDGGDSLLCYSEDYLPLRQAIAGYLGTARGVRCTADQVILIAGAQQGIDLTTKVLLEPGQAVWVEDPGYRGVHGAMIAAGAHPVAVPVDEEGLNVDAGIARHATAKLAHVTPSHQYPMGMTMSLRRRLELLAWASQAQAWILEDDYDSEYRYTGRPLAALQGLDREQRVIYLGTFSKVLFPALRLAYLVVPPDLVEAFTSMRFFATRHLPVLEQVTLAAFITEGHFARHIRRMRALYAQRQTLLVEAARRELAGLLRVCPATAGMHVLGWLPRGRDDVQASQQAAAQGIYASPLSVYSLDARFPPALILGYTAVGEHAIQEGVRRLARALRI